MRVESSGRRQIILTLRVVLDSLQPQIRGRRREHATHMELNLPIVVHEALQVVLHVLEHHEDVVRPLGFSGSRHVKLRWAHCLLCM